jgi:hypothetical protein
MIVCGNPKKIPKEVKPCIYHTYVMEGKGRLDWCAYGFAGAVRADDEGEGLEEGDDVLVLRVEAPDPLDQHLVHRAHLAPSSDSSPPSSPASVPSNSPAPPLA